MDANKTNFEIIRYNLPAYWASYLINGDGSGLYKADKVAADKFVENESIIHKEQGIYTHYRLDFVGCSDPFFSRCNDAAADWQSAGDVCTFTVQRHELINKHKGGVR